MKQTILSTIALVLMAAPSAFASEYQLTVQANLVKDTPTVFGSSSTTIPVTYSFNVESTAVTKIPANTAFSSAGYKFATDVYKIPRSALTGFIVTIGNATWTDANLYTQSLGNTGDFDILISGSLTSPTAIDLSLVDAVFGEVYFGGITCPTATCSLTSSGSAFSYQDSGHALMSSIVVSSNQVNTSVEDQLNSAITTIDTMSIAKGAKSSLTAKLHAALRVLKNSDKSTAKNILEAFKSEVEAQRKKALSDAQADALLSAANLVIASL